MVVATFKEGVTMDDIRALIPAEQAQAKALEAQGLIGAIKISMARRTTFIEAFAPDEAAALEAIHSLPMSTVWEIDIYPTTPPAGVTN